MNKQWHHICLVWDGRQGSGFTSFYMYGSEVKYQSCSEGPRTGGQKLQLGGGERTENVDMTSFYLWNRMLAEMEIADEAKTCNGGMGGPIVLWRHFYKKSLKTRFIREKSQCAVPQGEYFRLHFVP